MLRIPLSTVHLDEKVERQILSVVRSGQFILGPQCAAFEQELAAQLGVRHVVLSASWTAAVHLLHVAQTMVGQLKAGDEILVPALTAFPSIEPMIHAGAVPVFCDVDESYTIDPADAARKITAKTVGILPVHLYGHPANLDALKSLAAAHKLWIIEDCAQAHGATYRGANVGSMTEHAAFSFYPTKNLTVCGDGGAIATGNDEVARLVRMLRNHGRSDKYLHEHIGYNLRFNEIQAAIGREQLKRLAGNNCARRRIANLYREELGDQRDLFLPPDDRDAHSRSVYHLFVIRLARAELRDKLLNGLRERGIEAAVHYPTPNHLQPAIVNRFGRQPALPRTERFARQILSLPIYPGLSEADARDVAAAVRELLAAG